MILGFVVSPTSCRSYQVRWYVICSNPPKSVPNGQPDCITCSIHVYRTKDVGYLRSRRYRSLIAFVCLIAELSAAGSNARDLIKSWRYSKRYLHDNYWWRENSQYWIGYLSVGMFTLLAIMIIYQTEYCLPLMFCFLVRGYHIEAESSY